MLTVGKLIELLSVYNKDSKITNQQLQDFIHITNLKDGSVILSTEKPIGICKRTGGNVYKTEVKEEYIGYSPELDEDLYGFEILNLDYEKTRKDSNNIG